MLGSDLMLPVRRIVQHKLVTLVAEHGELACVHADKVTLVLFLKIRVFYISIEQAGCFTEC